MRRAGGDVGPQNDGRYYHTHENPERPHSLSEISIYHPGWFGGYRGSLLVNPLKFELIMLDLRSWKLQLDTSR
jgi:hypothetical protein